MIQRFLSTAFCWRIPAFASALASEAGFDGIELIVGRKRPAQWPGGVQQVHPSYVYLGQRGALTAIGRVFLGNVEGSVGWSLSRKYKVPLILHENTFGALGLDEVARRSSYGATIFIENIPEVGSLQRVADIVGGDGKQHGLNLKALLDIEHVLGEVGWVGGRINQHLDRAKQILARVPLGGVHICGLHPDSRHSWVEDTECNGDMLTFVAMLAREHQCPVTFEPFGTRSAQMRHLAGLGMSDHSMKALMSSAEIIHRYLG